MGGKIEAKKKEKVNENKYHLQNQKKTTVEETVQLEAIRKRKRCTSSQENWIDQSINDILRFSLIPSSFRGIVITYRAESGCIKSDFGLCMFCFH